MKIVQLLPELNEGGVERGVVELNRELVKRGFESIVISAGGRLAEQINKDGGMHVSFDVVSKNPLSIPMRVFRLVRLLRRLRPDLLHARSRVPAWLVFLANKRLRIPMVTTVHGFNSVNAYSRVMTFGDTVICVSHAVKSYIQSHYQVPSDKVVVIPRGVDLDLFNLQHIDREFVHGFQRQFDLWDKFVVTSVGRVSQLKDYETFIRAIDIARKTCPNVCGLIVGGIRQDKQGYYQNLQRLVQDLGLEEQIHFTGSQEKVAEIYALSDLVVSSSKKPESFGRAAAEALAMDVPVAATAHGGVTDIVISDKTGQLFNVGDSSRLAEIIVSLRTKEYTGLREWVITNFSLAQMVDKTVAVYNKLHRR